MPELNEIVPNLWQGSRSSIWNHLWKDRFDILVLCAEEWQPPKEVFPKVELIYAPNSDDPLRVPTYNELQRAVAAAREIAAAVYMGKKVLNTCMAGLNRSGLVSALALHFLTGEDGLTCMTRVRRKRDRALGNPQFQKVLSRVPKIRVGLQDPDPVFPRCAT
jgi:protein-tyrosine phosphatase